MQSVRMIQGNRISDLSQHPGLELSLQAPRLSFFGSDPFELSLRTRLSAMWRKTARLCGPLSIFVHGDVQVAVHAVLDAPMRTDGLAEPLWGDWRAQQIVVVVVLSAISRTRTTLPTAVRPGQPWSACSHAMSVETMLVRVSMRPWSPSTVLLLTDNSVSGSSRKVRTSSCSVPWLPPASAHRR